ncbi:MAG: helix-turn-helix domain-containing protein [Bacteroidota bacterium]
MAGEKLSVKSISMIHELMGLEKPKHPQITLIDAARIAVKEEELGTKLVPECYMISLKDKNCGMEYGRNSFDFDEGVLIFSAPGQTYSPTRVIEAGEIEGWMLYFHPDLIRNTYLSDRMDDYTFFNYEVFEALHLSADEEHTIHECVHNIQHEFQQRIDNHSQRVIVSNLDLLLSYCLRFYERQFNTRTNQSKDVISQFEKALKAYFDTQKHLELGLPRIQYFSEKANLSQHYFSDLVKKETGRSPKDHINDFIVEKAKNMLLGSSQSISEIAYDLGFNYPHYFTRIFKARTGKTPVEYRG